MPSALRTIDIDASLDAVMAVLTDFRSYPSFLPDIRAIEVLVEESGSTWEVRFHLHLVRALVYVLRLRRVSETELAWSLVEGAFRRNEGSWTLEALPAGATRATYRIDVSVASFVPAAVVRSLVDHALPDTLENFKREVERRKTTS